MYLLTSHSQTLAGFNSVCCLPHALFAVYSFLVCMLLSCLVGCFWRVMLTCQLRHRYRRLVCVRDCNERVQRLEWPKNQNLQRSPAIASINLGELLSIVLTPSLSQPVNFRGWKVLTHTLTCRQYIWWSCKKSNFNTLHFDSNPFSGYIFLQTHVTFCEYLVFHEFKRNLYITLAKYLEQEGIYIIYR